METLAELYCQSDLCLVISGTNLSLVPIEIMGCGRVAVCTKGAHSSWMVTEENAVLVDSEPLAIADTMEEYLKHPEKMEEICKKGMEFVRKTDWEIEADKVYEAMQKWIAEDEEKL